MIALSALFWFVMAVVFAGLEIEAEGKYGWAEKMPTWYRTTGLIARLYGLAMGGKPLTGYHSFMFFMPLLVFHAAFFQGAPWSIRAEIMTFAMYFAWAPLWDYLWFVLNPNYGFSNFRRENVWWHAQSPWILKRMPLDHLIGWILSIGLAALAAWYGQTDWTVLRNHGILMGCFAGLTVLTILVSPLYHKWYYHMRRRDDRDMAPIKHTLP